MKRAGALLAVAAALALMAARFTRLELAAFARDEPQFLEAARAQVATGHWLSANPLYGNLGLRYGPVAFWFYGVVIEVFGDHPETAIVAMGLLVTASHLALAWAIVRVLGERPLFLAVLLAWIASSPYFFHWSRIAWDLTSHAFVLVAMALATYRELRPRRAFAIGLALGAALGTHPSVTPFVLALIAVMLWEVRGDGRRLLRSAALVVGAIALVNLPYALFLLRAPVVGRAARVPLTLARMGSLVAQTPRLATVWGIDYYFESAWADFMGWLGGLRAVVAMLAGLGILVAAAGAVTGTAIALRSRHVRRHRLARAAALTWIGNVVLMAVLGLEIHPHYQFASAWIPFFGTAAAMAWLRARRPALGAVAMALLAGLALAQYAFVEGWMGYVRERGGTRGPSYGTALGFERAAMREACGREGEAIVLRNETFMYAFPFRYLATTEADCRGRRVIVCGEGFVPGPKPCPTPEPGHALVHLRYATSDTAVLRVE